MPIQTKGARGQVLPITLGLVLLAAVSLFMVFNSHRAVDEKINLVNAADAAAFSGAQMAARELNFMALTNRTMIANEVAIGHVMAYQTELDVVAKAINSGVGGAAGALVTVFFDLIGGDPTVNNLNLLNKVWSGAYILAVNATNALYQDFQMEGYRALAGIGRDSLLDKVMSTVAQQYEISPDVSISINTPEAIEYLTTLGVSELNEVASAAQENPFCSLILFATPSAAGGETAYDRTDRFSALSSECQKYYQTGVIPNALGSVDNAVADGGVLLALLNQSAANASSADWVLRRNLDYSVLIGSVQVERRGSSAAKWDSANGQINWQTNGNDTIRTRDNWLSKLILSFSGEASGDARLIANEAASRIGEPVVALLRTAGLCDQIDCNTLANTSYAGVQRYAMLNPLIQDPAPVLTAIAYQDRNCNDTIGKDAQGNQRLDFVTQLPMFGEDSTCASQRPVVAYARSRIYYQRPPCADISCSSGYSSKGVSGERPNLFNPFWQAKLASSVN